MRHIVNACFDAVYVVNLKRDVPQRLKMSAQLHRLGIEFKFWEATDGSQPPHLAAYEAYASRPIGQLDEPRYVEFERGRGTKLIHSPGAWGYMETYLALLRHVHASGVGSVLILEDDVLLDYDFSARFEALAGALPTNWLALLLGASQYGWDGINDAEARQQGYYRARPIETCGSFALGLRAEALPPLIAATAQFVAPFDFHALAKLYEAYPERCLVAYPALAMPDVAQSRIRGGRDQRTHAAKMRWDVDRFDYPPKRPLISVIEPSPAASEFLATPPIAQALDIRCFVREDDELRPRPLAPTPTRTPAAAATASPAADAPRPPTTATATAATPATGAVTIAPSLANLPPFVREADLCVWFADDAAPRSAEAFLAAIDNGLAGVEADGPAWSIRRPPQAPDASDLVSIIIPTHGRSDSLEAAIDSALAQTHANVEVLVVDDNPPGSPEAEHIEMLKGARRDPKLRWLHHRDNRGGAAARNTALMASRGAFVSFLDDDDTYEPQKVAASLAKLRALGPSFGAVYCGFLGGNASRRDPKRFRSGNLQLDVLGLEYASHYLNMDTALYRRRALARLGGFDEDLARHQDLDLNARFFEHYQIGCVEAWLVRIRPDRGKGIHLLNGPRLLATKRQFLAKFRPIIEGYAPADQQKIWLAHHRELARYFGGEGAFVREALDALDPVTQQLLLLPQRTSLPLAPRGRDGAAGDVADARRSSPRHRFPRGMAAGLLGIAVATATALHLVAYAPTASLLICLLAGLAATNVIIVDQIRRVGSRTLRNIYAVQRTLGGERSRGNSSDNP